MFVTLPLCSEPCGERLDSRSSLRSKSTEMPRMEGRAASICTSSSSRRILSTSSSSAPRDAALSRMMAICCCSCMARWRSSSLGGGDDVTEMAPRRLLVRLEEVSGGSEKERGRLKSRWSLWVRNSLSVSGQRPCGRGSFGCGDGAQSHLKAADPARPLLLGGL